MRRVFHTVWIHCTIARRLALFGLEEGDKVVRRYYFASLQLVVGTSYVCVMKLIEGQYVHSSRDRV
jgi:hypothetical protein